MRDLLEEVVACLDAAIYGPAVVTSFTIPDACGAIEYPDVKPSKRWIDWFDENVGDSISFRLCGKEWYTYRNFILHEAKSAIRTKDLTIDKVLLVLPGRHIMHDNLISHSFKAPNQTILDIDLSLFCRSMVKAASAWLDRALQDPVKSKLLVNLVQYRRGGYRPFSDVPCFA